MRSGFVFVTLFEELGFVPDLSAQSAVAFAVQDFEATTPCSPVKFGKLG